MGKRVDHTLAESMARLIDNWSNSKFAIDERLIITMRNAEVDSINQGIRELLKARSFLTGQEYRHYASSEKHEDYMAGDRILFKTTNKNLQIDNGDFATITAVSNDRFIAKTDNGKEVEFNPKEVNFKHGYASTVYKAQGSSIKDVYILHNLAGNSRNSYVAMTRHIEEVKLYSNRETIKDMASLISQLSKSDNNLASIHFKSLEELRTQEIQHNTRLPGIIIKIGNWFKWIVEDIHDRSYSNDNYYHPTILSNTATKIKNIFGNTKNLYQHHNAQEEIRTSSDNLKHHNPKDTITKIKLQEGCDGKE